MRKNRSIEPQYDSRRANHELATFERQHHEMEHWADDLFGGIGMPRMNFGGNYRKLSTYIGMREDFDSMFRGMQSHFESSFNQVNDFMQDFERYRGSE